MAWRGFFPNFAMMSMEGSLHVHECPSQTCCDPFLSVAIAFIRPWFKAQESSVTIEFKALACDDMTCFSTPEFISRSEASRAKIAKDVMMGLDAHYQTMACWLICNIA